MLSFRALVVPSLLLLGENVYGLDNGLALIPQMGWNTWNKFGCDIAEDTLLSAAKSLVQAGLDKLGYHYIVMDDCWSTMTRNSSGYLQYDPVKFPRGLPQLISDIHDLGLGFGIYGDAGSHTCQGYPGSLGNEKIDAELFASWGVDYLKYDNCYNEGVAGTPQISYGRYKAMTEALNATGRPILYSMCNWGEDKTTNWASTIANSFRISGDIYDNFNRYDDRCPCETIDCDTLQGNHCSVMNIVEKAAPLVQNTGTSAWNDLDSLEVGNGKMTFEEYKTHFSLWAMYKSPLLLGNDITNMTNETVEIITNTEIINLNQGDRSTCYRILKVPQTVGNYQLFIQWLSDASNSWIVAIVNNTPEPATITMAFEEIFVYEPSTAALNYTMRDLWLHANVGNASESVTQNVARHGIVVLELTAI